MCLTVEHQKEKNNNSTFFKLSTSSILENCYDPRHREKGEMAKEGSHLLRIYRVPAL